MNIYLKAELEKIMQEQKRLLAKAKNSSLMATTLANDHNAVLKEDLEKYNALLRMQEIIDKHFLNIKNRNEYLELAKLVGFKELDGYTYRMMVSTQVLYDRELVLTNRRINELKKANINLNENAEYQALLKMQEILKNGFDTMDYRYDYLKLRSLTNFPKISNDEYLILINQKLTKDQKEPIKVEPIKNDLNPRVKNEEALVIVPSPKKELVSIPDTPKKSMPPKEEEKETKTKSSSIPFKTVNGKSVVDMDYWDTLLGVDNQKAENTNNQPKQVVSEPKEATPPNVETTKVESPKFADGQKIKVVKKRKGAINWLSKNKKQILIAIAIASLVGAIIAVLFQVLPAINAATQAAEISKIGTSMVNNSLAWHGADTATQTILHSSNVTLAENLQNIAGIQSAYNNATGVWTVGGSELTHFAANAADAANATISGATSTIHNLLGITGIGTLGAVGALITKNKSAEYQEYHDQIIQMGAMSEEEQKELILSIHNSPTLTDNEKGRLIRKAAKMQEKIKKYDTKMGR